MKIIEDNTYIYAKSIEDIKKELILLKTSGYGCNSDIYIYKIRELLKVFKNRETMFKLTEMELLKEIKTKNIIKPIKFLLIDDNFYGFSMKKIDGSMLAHISPNTLLKDFLNSLVKLEKDLKNLSNEGFVNNDLNILNIIYNKNEKESYMIDVNSFSCYKNQSREAITIYNLMELYNTVLSILSKVPTFKSTDNPYLQEIRESIVTKTDYTIPINEYFKYFKEDLENYTENKINTIGDFRKSLKLIQ